MIIVTKDLMPGRFLLPIAQELEHRGHTVSVIAEGKSVGIWKAAGIDPLEDTGPDDVDFSSVGRVIVGCSEPINLEKKFASRANELGIPLVAFPDTWGSRRRLGDSVVPDLVLTIDKHSAAIDGKNSGDVAVVGDPLLPEVERLAKTVPDQMKDLFQGLRDQGKKILLVVGQHPSLAGDIIDFTVDCLEQSPQWVVIPRLIHPKLPDQMVLDAWELATRRYTDRVLAVDALWPTDQLAAHADGTVSVFSTVLRVASFAGKLPISVTTAWTTKGMEESTGLVRYPLVEMGYAFEGRAGLNLDDARVHNASIYFDGLRDAVRRASDAIE